MKRHGKILYPIGVLLFGFLGAFVLIKTKPIPVSKPPELRPPLVRSILAKTQDLRLTVRAQGTVRPRTQTTLISQVSGRVTAVSSAFASGGFFAEGDTLVTIDPSDYKLALARARAQVAQARVRLVLEMEEAELAEEEWERVGKGDPSDLVLRKPQLAEARAAIQAAEATEELARLNLDRTRIRAPYAGRVLSKMVDVGQFTNPGTPLTRVYAVDYAEVRLPISHDELAFMDLAFGFRDEIPLANRPEVLLRAVFAGKNHIWSGEIVRMEGEIDPQSRMVNLVARVKAPYDRGTDSDRPPLFVGLFVEAEIMGKVASDVVVIPRSALRGQDQVLIIDDETRLRFRSVDKLRMQGKEIVITSGLSEGEHICISPLDAVVDGMKIRIVDEAVDHQNRGSTG
jgi:RND family efflux transporter MFP subunit